MMRLCVCGHSDELHSAEFGICKGLRLAGWPAEWPGKEVLGMPGMCGCERFKRAPEQPSLVRRVLSALLGVRP